MAPDALQLEAVVFRFPPRYQRGKDDPRGSTIWPGLFRFRDCDERRRFLLSCQSLCSDGRADRRFDRRSFRNCLSQRLAGCLEVLPCAAAMPTGCEEQEHPLEMENATLGSDIRREPTASSRLNCYCCLPPFFMSSIFLAPAFTHACPRPWAQSAALPSPVERVFWCP